MSEREVNVGPGLLVGVVAIVLSGLIYLWIDSGSCSSNRPQESFKDYQKRVHFEKLRLDEQDQRARDLEQMRRWNEEQEYRQQRGRGW